MVLFIAKRLVYAFVTVLVVSVLAAFLIHVVPGDPVAAMMSQSSGATPEAMAQMRSRLGLANLDAGLPVYAERPER